MALQTSPEHPAPVRQIAQALGDWIGRLGWVWVEGEIAQLNLRPGVVFLTLRDTAVDFSVQVTCGRGVLDASAVPVTEGARVIVHAKPRYYDKRGSLSLHVDEIRPVGIGELLARLEQRRRLLAAEGLFEPARKRLLPFLPAVVGLVTGRDSAAERDVLENARRRWPGVRFRVVHASVQGIRAAAEVIAAVRTLDADPAVEVIIVARGGGSVEDLLPFSDEGLIRAVATTTTPLVSAIGHEPDSPILDLVADWRASTPTDAAKRVVPDVVEELTRVRALRDRTRRVTESFVRHEASGLRALRSRPALAAPVSLLDERAEGISRALERARRGLSHRLDRANDEIGHHLARTRALSPLATMRRGYAVVQDAEGHVVTRVEQAVPPAALTVRVFDGSLLVDLRESRRQTTLPDDQPPAEETAP
ncbi:MAG: exodeoxyribonuclease VII large subunit [Actinomycetota bacterium]|nr:exodeoxyribonuclease VII large subunit [Actinomycetota bacterium]